MYHKNIRTISIDIGGTYVKWAVIDEGLNIIEKGKFITDAFTLRAEGIFKNVGHKINELSSKYQDIIAVYINMLKKKRPSNWKTIPSGEK